MTYNTILQPGLLTILLKSIADTDTDIEIEKYRRYRYRYSTNRYFCIDVNFTGDIRRLIGGISNR
jgi:hypothetical protein